MREKSAQTSDYQPNSSIEICNGVIFLILLVCLLLGYLKNLLTDSNEILLKVRPRAKEQLTNCMSEHHCWVW